MKLKKTLIISSAIMALALVVTIVSVSAAWFGDIKHAETEKLAITSERPSGAATFDLTSYSKLNQNSVDLVPAIAIENLLLGGATVPNGAVLRTEDEFGKDTSSSNIQSGATSSVSAPASVASIYFPFRWSGTPDAGYSDGKKAIKIWIDTAQIKLGETGTGDNKTAILDPINYIDEFYITFSVVKIPKEIPEGGSEEVPTYDEDGNMITQPVASVSATKDSSGNITYAMSDGDDNVFYVNDDGALNGGVNNKAVYLLVPSYYADYNIKVEVSYNKVDEELNPATIDKTIAFGIKIQGIDRVNDFEPAVLKYIPLQV